MVYRLPVRKSGRESRSFRRIPTNAMAYLRKADVVMSQMRLTVNVPAVNVGRNGVFLKTDLPFKLDDLVRFDLIVPGNVPKMEVLGVVRWRRTRGVFGIGIEFLDVGLEDQKALEQFIDERISRGKSGV
jgi:hypothetical protein